MTLNKKLIEKSKKSQKKKRKKVKNKTVVIVKSRNVCDCIAYVFKEEECVLKNAIVIIAIIMRNLVKLEISLLKKPKKSILWLLERNITLLVNKENKKHFILEGVGAKRHNVIEITVSVLK